MFDFKSMFSSASKIAMHEYCNIEANVTKSVFVNKDGSYSTFIRIDGSAKVIEESGVISIVNFINSKLKGVLKKKGFRLQFVFEKDPKNSESLLKKSTDPILKNLKRLNIDLEDVILDRNKVLKEKTSYETGYLVVTTFTSAIPAAAQKVMKEARIKEASKHKAGIKPGTYGQSPLFELKSLRDTHVGFLNTVERVLSEFLFIERLSCHEAIYEIKRTIDNNNVNPKWKPSLLGDKIRPRLVEDSDNITDDSHILNMDIGFQLFNKIPVIPNESSTSVDYNGRRYACFNLDIPPQDITPFNVLFSDIPENIPWRISITLETGHTEIKNKINNKKSLATLLAITNSQNKEIKAAAEEFIQVADSGSTLISCKVALTTWEEDLDQLNINKSIFSQAIQGWGTCDLIEELGDPIELWLNTIPGISKKYITTPFPLFLAEALYILPITRPASPWKTGAMAYRTVDRKPYFYQPGTSKQQAWADLYFAPPGSGKSFKLAADNMGFVTNHENTMLPRIAMIDIGFSSASFVDYLRSCLPKHLQHLCQSHKLQMQKGDDSSNINPFDTALLCQYPLDLDREFIVNFLTMIFTPAGATKSIKRLPELAGALTDAMYKYFSEDGEPNIFQRGTLDDIDTLLEENDYYPSQVTTWWDIASYLFDKKEYRLAEKAQRYAVPTLNDVTTVITNSTDISGVFGKAKMDGSDELLIDFVKQMVLSAVNEFPILSKPSSFDVGGARIVSLDLSSVAQKGNAQADKKTAIMYMIARYALCKEYYRKVKDTIPQIPEKYQEYHKGILERESSVPKKICMDEYHRTSGSQGVRDQVELDLREGRKFNVHFAILSQRLEDFDESLVELADNVWILSKGKTEDVVDKIIEKFKPTEDSISMLKKYVSGPSSEGSSMLYIGNLKGNISRTEQVLYLTISNREIWGYTTVHEDYTLREDLVDKVGAKDAMNILNTYFKNGSAKDEMKSIADEVYEGSIYNNVANKLIKKYKNKDYTII
jgi:intracellular multiplication protein IcmB